jgi:hypothetical protein
MALCYHQKLVKAAVALDGRWYLACGQPDRCDYFQWWDAARQRDRRTAHGRTAAQQPAPSRGNGLCHCGVVTVRTSGANDRPVLRCPFKACAYYQNLMCKPLPPPPTASARRAEAEARAIVPLSSLVNRGAALPRMPDVQECSALERMRTGAAYVLRDADGHERYLDDASPATVESARVLNRVVRAVSTVSAFN